MLIFTQQKIIFRTPGLFWKWKRWRACSIVLGLGLLKSYLTFGLVPSSVQWKNKNHSTLAQMGWNHGKKGQKNHNTIVIIFLFIKKDNEYNYNSYNSCDLQYCLPFWQSVLSRALFSQLILQNIFTIFAWQQMQITDTSHHQNLPPTKKINNKNIHK